jgi:hypothetical protein
MQPNVFFGGFKCHNIFGLTGGCSDDLLFVGGLGNSPGTEGANATAHTPAGIKAVGPIGVAEHMKCDGKVTPKV